LPKQLKKWLINAKLPWSPQSIQRVYNHHLSSVGNPHLALEELDRLQEYQLAKDRKT
jgi:hypothetical protein